MNMQFTISTVLSLVTLLWRTELVSTTKPCPNCGRTVVPFPLSTEPECGDQQYKVRCEMGKLWFDALNSSSYEITLIDPPAHRLVVRPPGLAKDSIKTCMAADFRSHGIQLNDTLPFNISGSNTVVGMNCSSEVLEISWNCSSNSPCHDYIRSKAMKECGSLPICCVYRTGGSVNEFRIRAREQRCSAYEVFVNLDSSMPVTKWPMPGVEIEWVPPGESMCKTSMDCQAWANSECLADQVGKRRCLCKAGFRWDPINGVCQNLRCSKGRSSYCKNKTKIKTSLIGGLAFAGVAILIGIMTTMIMVYKRREHNIQRESKANISMREDLKLNANYISNNGMAVAKIFNTREITKATNNFSKQNLLGSGGFGEVFKAVLDDGRVTAVKRAKPGSTKGAAQIINEVRILCQVNHRSLVQLLGCCVELDLQPILVYEFVPNGTLFDHIHNRHAKTDPLSWRRRLAIAYQTAEGLAYLHTSAIPRIYHRDVKSSNILLNEKFDAKVADFGLSRLVVTETSHITTCAQGTLGYLDPEYYINFQLTDKSDVYSFGVVLLELLTSKKAIDFNREEEDVNLVVYVKKLLREERLLEAIDSELKEGADKLVLETIKALGSLAVACLDERRQNRPSMKHVAEEIEYIISIVDQNNGVVPLS
ncbi:hypothetical protein F8388_010994 [Cannabis sativa]|uniref:Protein kinase domain-containing protein n=1 Tax=Cannabis sativa TaxID=3483 RepID=A0A7J6FQX0_CANSA|nr:hypothetical protein F8388_010994 [Cannabis sativa]